MLTKLYRHLLKHGLLDSTIMVGIITAFSYLLTYLYESTYMQYFGAGSESARVELVPVITTSFAVFTAAILSAALLYMIAKVTQGEGKFKVLARLMLTVAFVITFGLLPILYSEDPYNFRSYIISQFVNLGKVVAGVAILTLLIEFVVTAIMRVVKGQEIRNKLKTKKIESKLFPFGIIAPLLTLTLFFEYATTLAVVNAYNKQDYKLVKEAGVSMLVIREYSNHIVAMQYDSRTNRLLPKYFYIEFGSQSDFSYTTIHKRPIYVSPYLERLQKQNSNNSLGL